MKIGNVFKLFKGTNSKLNIIHIGYTTYYIIEITENTNFLNNKLISKLMLLEIPLYWFSNYNEFEDYFLNFDDNSKKNIIIIY